VRRRRGLGQRGLRVLGAAGAASLLLVAAGFITWFASGIPPAFVPVWFRLLVLVWVVLVGVGTVLALREASKAPTPAKEGRRWPLRPRRWAVWLSVGAAVVALVALTFVIDDAFPAWMLGPDPQVSVVSDVSFREAQGRRDVDRTRVWFETSEGLVEAWAADPNHALTTGSRVVYDPEHPQRVMDAQAWGSARSTPWRLPVAILLVLVPLVLPATIRHIRSRRYGSLRPGRAVTEITRPGRAKVLQVRWADGRSATYVDVPGLTDSLRHKVSTDGESGVRVP
jgi:antibiotic biosynthesis monooxygenase (ABM) superfamily enzyme